MKIREGFVSNSSSTAFIIRTHYIVPTLKWWEGVGKICKKIITEEVVGCCDWCAEYSYDVECPNCGEGMVRGFVWKEDLKDLNGFHKCYCGAEVNVNDNDVEYVGHWYESDSVIHIPI